MWGMLCILLYIHCKCVSDEFETTYISSWSLWIVIIIIIILKNVIAVIEIVNVELEQYQVDFP